jgi:hypothetical protein
MKIFMTEWIFELWSRGWILEKKVENSKTLLKYNYANKKCIGTTRPWDTNYLWDTRLWIYAHKMHVYDTCVWDTCSMRCTPARDTWLWEMRARKRYICLWAYTPAEKHAYRYTCLWNCMRMRGKPYKMHACEGLPTRENIPVSHPRL